MAIYALVGKSGHGKSYSALELFILVALRQGRIVYTNIPLRDKILDDFPNAQLYSIDYSDYEKDRTYWEKLENGALVVLDELYLIWPAGTSVAKIRKEDLVFIKQHRHRKDSSGRIMDIVFVTQNLGDVAKSIYEMAETTIMCSQLMDVGMADRFRRDYYKGAVTGFTGKADLFIRSDDVVKYDPFIYKYYVSHTQSIAGSIETTDETKVVSATVFQGLKFKILGFSLILCLVIIVFALIHASSGIRKITNTKESYIKPFVPVVSATNNAPTNPVVELKQLTPSAPSLSSVWRLSGFVRRPGLAYVILTNGHDHRRIDSKYCKFELEIECVVGLDIYTRYSGHRELALSQVLTQPVKSSLPVESLLQLPPDTPNVETTTH